MFPAYEAVAVVPENLPAIRVKLSPDELVRWNDLLTTRAYDKHKYYMIFNIVENLENMNCDHVIVPAEMLTEHYATAKYDEYTLWISKLH